MVLKVWLRKTENHCLKLEFSLFLKRWFIHYVYLILRIKVFSFNDVSNTVLSFLLMCFYIEKGSPSLSLKDTYLGEGSALMPQAFHRNPSHLLHASSKRSALSMSFHCRAWGIRTLVETKQRPIREKIQVLTLFLIVTFIPL